MAELHLSDSMLRAILIQDRQRGQASDDRDPCDGCGQPSPFLYTHLVPRRLFPDHAQPSGALAEVAACLVLCARCGAQRREDLRAFFRGAAPSRLVWPEWG